MMSLASVLGCGIWSSLIEGQLYSHDPLEGAVEFRLKRRSISLLEFRDLLHALPVCQHQADFHHAHPGPFLRKS